MSMMSIVHSYSGPFVPRLRPKTGDGTLSLIYLIQPPPRGRLRETDNLVDELGTLDRCQWQLRPVRLIRPSF